MELNISSSYFLHDLRTKYEYMKSIYVQQLCRVCLYVRPNVSTRKLHTFVTRVYIKNCRANLTVVHIG